MNAKTVELHLLQSFPPSLARTIAGEGRPKKEARYSTASLYNKKQREKADEVQL